jgi:hypothetical protein
MITSLTGGEVSGEDVPVTASEITGTRLADDVVLVTYVSQRNQRRAAAALSGAGQPRDGASISIKER